MDNLLICKYIVQVSRKSVCDSAVIYYEAHTPAPVVRVLSSLTQLGQRHPTPPKDTQCVCGRSYVYVKGQHEVNEDTVSKAGYWRIMVLTPYTGLI